MKTIWDTDAVVYPCGNVFGPKGIKKLSVTANGYKVFSCNNIKTGKRITYLYHRALWESLVGPIPKGLVINHKDGNKLHNDIINNLEVITLAENTTHSRDVLGNKYANDCKFSIEESLALLTFQMIHGYSDTEKLFNLPNNTLRTIFKDRKTYPVHTSDITAIYLKPCTRVRGNCISYWTNQNGKQHKITKDMYDTLLTLKVF